MYFNLGSKRMVTLCQLYLLVNTILMSLLSMVFIIWPVLGFLLILNSSTTLIYSGFLFSSGKLFNGFKIYIN